MNPDLTFVVFTKRNALALGTGIGIAGGVMTGNPVPLAFALLFAALLTGAFWYSRGLLDGFSAERTHYPRCLQGETLRVGLTLRNSKSRPALMLNIVDRFDPALDSSTRMLAAQPIRPGEQASIGYRRTCSRRRGLYVLGPTTISAADPLGLFERTRSLENFSELRVAPRLDSLDRFEAVRHGVLRGVGIEAIQRPGPGEEFLQLREYRQGDNPKRIHWPSSARRGRLLVKEFDSNISTDVGVFVDLSRLAHAGLGEYRSAELAIQAAGSIAVYAIERQHRVGLFLVGEEVDTLPIGGGWAHLNAVLDRLTVSRVGGDRDFIEDVTQRLNWLRRGATAVFVLTVSGARVDEMTALLNSLAFRGVMTHVALIDDRGFTRIWHEQIQRQSEAPEPEELAAAFTLAGAKVYRLAREDNPAARLDIPFDEESHVLA